MMRLLYLALDCPWPANNGLRLRTWAFLRALHAENCRVTLVCLQATEAPGAAPELHQVCEAFWVLGHEIGSLSQGRNWSGQAGAMLSRLPYAARRFRSQPAYSLLQRLWAGSHWDAVLCDTVYGAINVPPGVQPLVLNHHNIEHRIFDTYRATARGRLWRSAAAWEGRKVRSWEIEVGRRTALNFVCSTEDAERLRQQQPQARIVVAPNIVLPAAETPAAEDPDLVVFQGALDWLPNRDAVDYFLAAIWPAVLRAHPAAHLAVVGRRPPVAFLARHRAQPRTEFTGTVADVRPWLARAAVAIAPLRMGSGTRLKILEAAACGKAIVATPLGAEGLDFQPGIEIELAADAGAFAAAVIGLLRSPLHRQQLGTAARARAARDYSLSALRQALRAALQPLPAAASPHAESPALATASSGRGW